MAVSLSGRPPHRRKEKGEDEARGKARTVAGTFRLIEEDGDEPRRIGLTYRDARVRSFSH